MAEIESPETVLRLTAQIVAAHIERLTEMIRRESSAELLAAAAVMLAVSIGFSPDEAMR